VVNPAGIINTIAGAGTPGYSGDNGPALNAQFNNAFAVALDTSGNLHIADRANNVVRLLQPVSSTPSAAVVTNGASNLTGPISPGETVAIYGNGIGPSTLAVYQSGSDIPMQTGGTSVSVNGVPAPVLYAWANQLGIQVPYEVTPGKGTITIQYGGRVSAQLPVTVASAAPGLFTLDETGAGQAVALNEDGSLNATGNPVTQGHVVSLYLTGYGLVAPVVRDGAPNTPGSATPLQTVTATVGGLQAAVAYAGGAKGLPAGTIRVDIRVPSGVSGSAIPVAVQVGSAESQQSVTIAVQ